jgi:hypothetical protein
MFCENRAHVWLALAALVCAIPQATPALCQARSSAPPSPEEFLGYSLGAEFTPHARIRDYAQMLAERTREVAYLPYGRTFEGRELIQIAIARADYQSRLDEILALNAELTRAGTTEARARQIAATNPAVVYFSFGVHGNETSSSEAALWTAYNLVTGAAEVANVLDSLIVVIDPVTNPDGRERYVNWYRSVVGGAPNADPQSREHSEPWPGGRANHYLFDLNRDWAWMTQPETRARIATWWRWNPQVHVDFHEMGPTNTYFFFPAAAPINPIFPSQVLAWWRRFGEENARSFDAHGWSYYTSENYDMLYPGYGDTWPTLQGAIGMTYEEAGGGSAGLRFARAEGDTLTLTMRATQHRATAAATLRAAAAGKTKLLLDFAESFRTAGDDHPDFLLVPGTDRTRLDALVDHLLAQGIEVERANRSVRIAAEAYPGYSRRREFPAGTVLVRAKQPHGRLAVTLLQPVTELRAEFSYDISAWSLPYAYGVEAHETTAAPTSGWERATPSVSGGGSLSGSNFGYLVAPNDSSAVAIIRFLAGGGSARVLTKKSTFGGREFPPGTWFISAQSANVRRDAANRAGIGEFATPIVGGLSDSGIDLGSENAREVELPRVALLGGEGISSTSFGAHWFFLEQQVGFPFDPILLAELGDLDLDKYDVIVVPEMSGDFDEDATEALTAWLRAGGRLVAVGSGADAAATLADVELRERDDDDDDDATNLDRLLATRAERERREWENEVPGVILPVRVDPGHPFAWGTSFDGSPERLFVLHTAGHAFEPREGSETVASFGPELEATSGVISEENLELLERSAWLITRNVGQGQVTLFADDPLFRLIWYSTKPLYLNALLYGRM